MRMQMREQFICCFLAVILFLAGMCVEVPPADASFLYAKEVSDTDVSGSVLRASSSYIVLEQVCTIETLERDNTTILSSNRGLNLKRRCVRAVVVLLTAGMLLSYLFCLDGERGTVFAKTVSSQTTIVRYIQQMDGKK